MIHFQKLHYVENVVSIYSFKKYLLLSIGDAFETYVVPKNVSRYSFKKYLVWSIGDISEKHIHLEN